MRTTNRAKILTIVVTVAIWPSAAWSQRSGSSANAVAGALCCTVQGGANAQDDTLSSDTTSEAAASFASPGVGISNSVLANASAYSNLATGKIGAAGYSTDYGYTSASSTFIDTLSFNISGASASTITPIVFSIVYHGTIDQGYGGVNTQFIFNANQDFVNGVLPTAGVLVINRDKGSGNDAESFYSRVQDYGWINFASQSDQLGETYTIRAVLGLLGPNPVLRVQQRLGLTTRNGANADFMETASLGLSTPDGVTYTSASGVFLTQATAAVPEPATWAMMIAGFGMIGGVARRGASRKQLA